jgi:TonB family protein
MPGGIDKAKKLLVRTAPSQRRPAVVAVLLVGAALFALAAVQASAQDAPAPLADTPVPQRQSPFDAKPHVRPTPPAEATEQTAAKASSDGSAKDAAFGNPYHCFSAEAEQFKVLRSDVHGVDFCYYIQEMMRITHKTWVPLVPREVDAPFHKSGTVEVEFSIQPDGKLEAGTAAVVKSSGDSSLDRASLGAIETAKFGPLPAEYHGASVRFHFGFLYNPDEPEKNAKKPRLTPRYRGPGLFTVGYNARLCCALPKAR